MDEQDLIIDDGAESEVEKKRKEWREKKRKSRAKEKQIKVAQSTEAESAWHERNRTLLSPTELEAMLAQDRLCLEHIEMMEYAIKHNISLDDLNYIFEKDSVAELVEFIKTHGVAHLGYIHKDPDIPPGWSSGKYWQDQRLLELLYAEGPATENVVKYGLLSGVPDYRVGEFLRKIAKWSWYKVAALLGQGIDSHNFVKYR
jgi:hypothetical protein